MNKDTLAPCIPAAANGGISDSPTATDRMPDAGKHFVTPPLKSGKPYITPLLPWPLPQQEGQADLLPPEAPVPDEASCLDLWQSHGMLEHIGRHSRVVADLAEALARRSVELGLAEPASIALTRAAGLLHDIAKSYSVQYGGSHAQLGASWVIAATGHRRLAQAVYHHVEWPWALPERLADGPLAPLFFVIYADKRAMHDSLVGVEERYDDLMLRYGKSAHSRAAIERGRKHALTIECALSAQLEFPLHESTVAGGRLVKRA